ncbi:hypothetical protein LCGC14_0224690 [marine sediment metagenome]|uniref:Uncharacterized protein n=1 Tax=marine sediment metagenome TaxID=412755 RepID=A0A0F9UCI1_9ZZZZ|nr:hypothetical protein [bacterium]
MSDIRHFRGRHKIKVLIQSGKHAYIKHLEDGYVGNKEIGYKNVKKLEKDITVVRLCWGRKL